MINVRMLAKATTKGEGSRSDNVLYALANSESEVVELNS